MGGKARAADELVDGLYEEVLSETRAAQVGALAATGRKGDVESIPSELIADHLARAIHSVARVALHSVHGENAAEQQLKIANQAIESIAQAVKGAGDASALLAKMLMSVASPRALAEARAPARPLSALSRSELFVNAEKHGVIQELLSEIESSDQIDLLMSFIKWSGFVKFRDALAAHCERRRGAVDAEGKPVAALRVLSTIYMGATDAKAIEALRALGADVRISYETAQTRLHAKAWLFHRRTGMSTAYVGSSNLSHAAMTDGLEWNVRLSSAELPRLIERFSAVFERYWSDRAAGFEPYGPDDVARLREALKTARGLTNALPGYSPALQYEARDYQRKILEDLASAREVHGHRKNLVVAATGTGKTVVAALDYQRLRASKRVDSLLFVAHRKEILEQSRRRFAAVLGERPDWGELLTGDEKPTIGKYVFASIQSLDRLLKDQPPAPDAFDMVIIDEVHHAAADTYQALLDLLKPRELLGLTATPERTDGLNIAAYFDRPWASEVRIWDAINAQILVPFNYFAVDLPGVDVRSAWERGRYQLGALSELLTSAHASVDHVVRSFDRYVRAPAEMRALAFCVDKAHAHFVAQRLNAITGLNLHAVALTSDDDFERRQAVVRAFESNSTDRPRVLCVVDLFNEGVDIPSIDTLLMLRPTESATLFIQQLGRGLRRSPGKDCLTVLDYVGVQHEDFRFEDRLAAATGLGRKQLEDGLEARFERLPSGCSVQLEPLAMRQVLARLRTSLDRSTRSLARRLGQLPASTTLREFLDAEGLELADLYRKKRHWNAVQREAGRDLPVVPEDEAAVLENVQALIHVDDLERLSVLRGLAESTHRPSGELEERRARMLLTVLFDRGRAVDLPACLEALARMPAVRAELRALAEARSPHARLVGTCAAIPDAVPLRLHASYLTEEVAAAFDLRSEGGKVQLLQRGLEQVDDGAFSANLLLVKLDKSASSKVPHLQYEDYATSPTGFHWESQQGTRQASREGRRILDPDVKQLLFVREKGKDDRGLAVPYVFLGAARKVHAEGDAPIRVQWELDVAMPAELLARARAVVA